MSGLSAVFGSGLILLALAAVADFIGGRFMRSTGAGSLYLLGAAGSACLAVVGGFALAGPSSSMSPAGSAIRCLASRRPRWPPTGCPGCSWR